MGNRKWEAGKKAIAAHVPLSEFALPPSHEIAGNGVKMTVEIWF